MNFGGKEAHTNVQYTVKPNPFTSLLAHGNRCLGRHSEQKAPNPSQVSPKLKVVFSLPTCKDGKLSQFCRKGGRSNVQRSAESGFEPGT